jgi:hypothetical protein
MLQPLDAETTAMQTFVGTGVAILRDSAIDGRAPRALNHPLDLVAGGPPADFR